MSKLLPLVFKLHFIPFHVRTTLSPRKLPCFITESCKLVKEKTKEVSTISNPSCSFFRTTKGSTENISWPSAFLKWTYSGLGNFRDNTWTPERPETISGEPLCHFISPYVNDDTSDLSTDILNPGNPAFYLTTPVNFILFSVAWVIYRVSPGVTRNFSQFLYFIKPAVIAPAYWKSVIYAKNRVAFTRETREPSNNRRTSCLHASYR